jgi:hypothetical protein
LARDRIGDFAKGNDHSAGQFIAGSQAATLPVSVIFQLLAAICSALLTIGLWTHLAGLFIAVSEPSLLLFPSISTSMDIVLATLGVALAMIGPGAWSVDAHLFGRKRIRIRSVSSTLQQDKTPGVS